MGGRFSHIGGGAARRIAALDLRTGLLDPTSDGRLSSWKPLNNRPVHGMAVSPDGDTVYTAEGGSGGWIGAFRPGTVKPVWIGRVDGDVLGITATDQRVYVGGHSDPKWTAQADTPEGPPPGLRHVPGDLKPRSPVRPAS